MNSVVVTQPLLIHFAFRDGLLSANAATSKFEGIDTLVVNCRESILDSYRASTKHSTPSVCSVPFAYIQFQEIYLMAGRQSIVARWL